MRNEPNKKMIGLFMVIGLAILTIIIGLFIKSKFFNDKGNILVMYFDESINGLNVGSPVVFKGVEIGKVIRIEVLADAEGLTFSIPVFVKMDSKQSINHSDAFGTKANLLDALIEKGLRGRLVTQSYLTGQLMIELEMLPDTPIKMRKPLEENDIFEIPTILSPLGELSKGIQDLPIRDSVEQFNAFFTSLNKDLPQILPQIKNMVSSMDKVIAGNAAATADTLDNVNKAAMNISQAAKALRNFADYIERHPEALLKGKRGTNE